MKLKRIRRLLYDIKRCFKSPIPKEITDKMRWDFVTYLCTKLPGNISTQSVNYHVLTDNAVLLEYDLYYSSNTRLYICCIATILRDGEINYKFFNQVSEQCF